MERVQHTSTSLTLCLFFVFEGTRISTTCRLFTFSGSRSSIPPTLRLIACPCPSENFTVLGSTGFVISKGTTNLQGTRSLSLRSRRVGILDSQNCCKELTTDPLGRESTRRSETCASILSYAIPSEL